MASSKVIASPISPDPDLNRRHRPLSHSRSSSSINSDSNLAVSSSSMTADVLLDPLSVDPGTMTVMRHCSSSKCGTGVKTEAGVGVGEEMMTLEEFLARAWEQEEEEEDEDVKGLVGERLIGFVGNGVVNGGGEIGRGKKRCGGVVLEPLDRAAQQRQRRMIKNRESAARSRERKQAYQSELECIAAKLEKENDQLLREKEEWTKGRFRQLMEKIVPVVERRRPARVFKRVRSSEW